MGLLKKMNVKRLPLKGLAELRARQAEDQGGDEANRDLRRGDVTGRHNRC